MRMGIWTPLPHTIRAEPRMEAAVKESLVRGQGGRPDKAFAYALEVLLEAEKIGFETTLIAERYNGPDLEAWMLAAALATHTSKLELLVAVHPGMVNPQIVAKLGATLDQLSSGRAAINVVNGWWQKEFELYGNGSWLDQSNDRYERMEEYIRVILDLWTKDTSNFDGKYYKVKEGTLPSTPVRLPHPPIYCSSLSEIGKEGVARVGDYWFPTPREDNGHLNFDRTASIVQSEIADMNARTAKYGRKVQYGISGHVIAAETQEEALARAKDLEEYGQLAMMHMVVSKSINTGLVGTYEEVADRIVRYHDMGIEFTMLHFYPMLEGVRSFGRHVLPLVRSRLK